MTPNPCELTECQGKPRCKRCLAWDAMDAPSPSPAVREALVEKLLALAWNYRKAQWGDGPEYRELSEAIRSALSAPSVPPVEAPNLERFHRTEHGLVSFGSKYIGEVHADDDGYFKWWPDKHNGYLDEMFLQAMASYLHRLNEKWDAEVAKVAAPPRASAPVQEGREPVAQIKWSEPSGPNAECSYDHITAATPFGRFLLTWKSHKDYPGYGFDETPWGESAYLGWNAPQDACRWAENEYARRAAQPPGEQP